MLKNRQISHICRKKHKPRVKPAKITYLHNAAGQRVFKSEPTFAQAAPDETELGTDFITWLKKNFGWLYATAQTNATLGQSYVYADGQLPEYALLAEYGNGAASGSGRLEYIWLPTDSGAAIPIGVYRGSRFYAIHADHLNTPRLMTDDSNKAVWQWPYSAFGDNKPTGILKAATNPNNAVTQDQTTNALLKATTPAVKFNLRYPGQYADDESNMFYNYQRSYQFGQGKYPQADPIGLGGGLNRFGYSEQNPLSLTDPLGQNAIVGGAAWGGSVGGLPGAIVGGVLGAGAMILADKLCTPDDPCPPCKPYGVGTIGWQGPKTSVDGIDGTRSGTGREHYILFEVQQSPKKSPKPCVCRWQETNKVAGHHYYFQPNLFMTVNLNGKGRPPSYP